MADGKSITLGGTAFALAPLTLGALRKGGLLPQFAALAKAAKTAQGDESDVSRAELSVETMACAVRESVIAAGKIANTTYTREAIDEKIDALDLVELRTVLMPAFRDVLEMSKFDKASEHAQGEAPGA